MNGANNPQRGHLVDEEGNVKCTICQGIVRKSTSGPGSQHPGKPFFRCFPCRDTKKRHFFYWADDLAVAGWGTPRFPPPNHVEISSTPRPSQAQRAASARGLPSMNPSPPATPSKRSRDEDDIPSTPSKRQATQSGPHVRFTPSKSLTESQKAKRTAIMEAAMRGSSAGSTQGYATPLGSQIATSTKTEDDWDDESVAESNKGIQTDPVLDEDEEEKEFWTGSGLAAGTMERKSSQVSAHDFTDGEESEVEDAIAHSPVSGRESSKVPPVTPQNPRRASHALSESGNPRTSSMEMNPMPTPPHTSQMPSRISRLSLSREMDEDEDEPSPRSSRIPSHLKGKEKLVSKFAKSDAHALASPSGSQDSTQSVAVFSALENASEIFKDAMDTALTRVHKMERKYSALLRNIELKEAAIKRIEHENEQLRKENKQLSHRNEQLAAALDDD